jgi:7-cyano-7-deazaguanine synthase
MPGVVRTVNNLLKIPSENKSAVILCSGGLDSSSLLALSSKHGFNILPITLNYGSKHNHAEFNALLNICNHLKIRKPIHIDISFMGKLLKSSLLQKDVKIPHGHYAKDNMGSTVVPGRNSIMLSIALGIAQSNNMSWVGIANHADDHFIYPDCRKEYIDYLAGAFNVASEGRVGILSPFVNIDKFQIAKVGNDCGLPLEITWSCYEGDFEKGQCGLCGTCTERHWSILKVGLKDKTIYQNDPKVNFTEKEKEELGLI